MALAVLAQNLLFLRRLRKIRQPFACMESPVPVWLASGLPSPCLRGCSGLRNLSHARSGGRPETRQFCPSSRAGALSRAGPALEPPAPHLPVPVLVRPHRVACRGAFPARLRVACDERVLKDLDPGSRASYGRALLSLVAPKRAKGQLLSCATTMQLGEKEPQRAHHAYREKSRKWRRIPLFCAGLESCSDGLHVYKRRCSRNRNLYRNPYRQNRSRYSRRNRRLIRGAPARRG